MNSVIQALHNKMQRALQLRILPWMTEPTGLSHRYQRLLWALERDIMRVPKITAEIHYWIFFAPPGRGEKTNMPHGWSTRNTGKQTNKAPIIGAKQTHTSLISYNNQWAHIRVDEIKQASNKRWNTVTGMHHEEIKTGANQTTEKSLAKHEHAHPNQ